MKTLEQQKCEAALERMRRALNGQDKQHNADDLFDTLFRRGKKEDERHDR